MSSSHSSTSSISDDDGEPSSPPPRRESNGVVSGSALPEQVHEFGGDAWDSSGRGNPDVDGPPSPSSSGYAAERGSSTATSGTAMDELVQREIEEIRIDDAVDGIADSQASWLPGKRYGDEVCVVGILLLWVLVILNLLDKLHECAL